MSRAANKQQAHDAVQKEYDPIKTVDAMFNGSLICLTQALQSNPEWIARAKQVISECSKKYQDALDDCEIQILQAKHYLEHQLAENKVKREAALKAQEETSNKRKLEDVKPVEQALSAESPAKRAKSVEPSTPSADKPATQPVSSGAKQPQTQSQQESGQITDKSQPSTHSEPAKKEAEAKTSETFNADDFFNASPQSADNGNDNDFTFDSMFNDSPTEENNGNDTNFEDQFINVDNEVEQPNAVEVQQQTEKEAAIVSENKESIAKPPEAQEKPKTPVSTQPQVQARQPQNTTNNDSLGSLLSGLEQFANQTDEDNNNTNEMNMDINMDDAAGVDGDDIFTGDFDMGPNIFDEAFQDGGDYDNMDMQDIGEPNDINLDDFDFTT